MCWYYFHFYEKDGSIEMFFFNILGTFYSFTNDPVIWFFGAVPKNLRPVRAESTAFHPSHFSLPTHTYDFARRAAHPVHLCSDFARFRFGCTRLCLKPLMSFSLVMRSRTFGPTRLWSWSYTPLFLHCAPAPPVIHVRAFHRLRSCFCLSPLHFLNYRSSSIRPRSSFWIHSAIPPSLRLRAADPTSRASILPSLSTLNSIYI